MKDVQLLILTLAVVVSVYLGYREIRKMQTQMDTIQKRIDSLQTSEPFYAHPENPFPAVHHNNPQFPVNSASAPALPNQQPHPEPEVICEPKQMESSESFHQPAPGSRTIFGTATDDDQRKEELMYMNEDDDSISSEKIRNIENLIQKIDQEDEDGDKDSLSEGPLSEVGADSKPLGDLVENLDPLPTVQRDDDDEFSETDEGTDVHEASQETVDKIPQQTETVTVDSGEDTASVDSQEATQESEMVNTPSTTQEASPIEQDSESKEDTTQTNEASILPVDTPVSPNTSNADVTEMTYDSLMQLTVKELRKMASAASVSTKGNKELLVQKLLVNGGHQ